MENLILAAHIIIGLTIIVFVLLQQGKGAEAGASFGAGASQTLFGSVGTWNFFSKVTALLAAAFFVTSFTLAVLASKSTDVEDDLLPELEIFQGELDSGVPEVSEIPVLEAPQMSESELPGLEIPSLETDLESSDLDEVPVDQQLPSQP